jgi:alginate O-acetyltransferase complex protein AlgI
MLFNSLSFLAFFPLVVIAYYILPNRFRTYFLLLASCIFYMAFVPKYILVLFTLITLDFFLAQLIERHSGRRRTLFLLTSVAANLGMLFFFKYFNFFNINVAALAAFLHWNYAPSLLKIALPLGLSFHVFQSLSYVIEVYKRRYPAERDYFVYALYVMFFPQLVAGPIERPAHLLPQLKIEHRFDATRVRRGLERMLWGFFKKLVIADNIAPIVSYVYGGTPTDGPLILVIAVLFAFQLYCDFSGYSDIAIGGALVLGMELTENFDRPYSSRSMAEFWRRWHISLSNWLRDYLYYPLVVGWGRASRPRIALSLIITFVLIGLWHGANWTYAFFGAINGFYLTFGLLTASWRERLVSFIKLSQMPRVHHALQVMVVFCLWVFCLIFFRSRDISQAWEIISHMGVNTSHMFDIQYWRYQVFTDQIIGAKKAGVAVICVAILFMEIVQYMQAKMKTLYVWETKSNVLHLVWNYAILFSILFFGHLGAQTFIYFQF